MAGSKVDPDLMRAGEKAFWAEFDERDKGEDRFYVIDRASGEVIVQNARLTKQKRKVRV